MIARPALADHRFEAAPKLIVKTGGSQLDIARRLAQPDDDQVLGGHYVYFLVIFAQGRVHIGWGVGGERTGKRGPHHG
jgi:hypothetical protein